MLYTKVLRLVFGVGCSRLACRQRQKGGEGEVGGGGMKPPALDLHFV